MGLTIELGFSGTHVLNGAVYLLQYDVLNDFTPISPLATGPFVLFAGKTADLVGLCVGEGLPGDARDQLHVQFGGSLAIGLSGRPLR
jgi:hypothetical protein